MCVRMCMYLRINTLKCVRVSIYVHTYSHVCISVYTYINMYLCIHTHRYMRLMCKWCWNKNNFAFIFLSHNLFNFLRKCYTLYFPEIILHLNIKRPVAHNTKMLVRTGSLQVLNIINIKSRLCKGLKSIWNRKFSFN